MSDENRKEHICNFCGKEYASRQSLFTHKNNIHKDEAESERRKPTLRCGHCETLFRTQLELCGHLSKDHEELARVEEKEFTAVDEFLQWKQEQERNGLFHFCKSGGDRVDSASGCKRQYFQCHRSGAFHSQATGKRAPRHNESVQVNFQCSAFAFAKIDSDGHVNVTYCLDHYKHDSALSNIRLPEEVRKQVAQYLIEKRSFEWIFKKIRSKRTIYYFLYESDGYSVRHF